MCKSRPIFIYFRSFQTIYRIKTVDFSGIGTRIIGLEGKDADHFTTTTVRYKLIFMLIIITGLSLVAHYCQGKPRQTFLTSLANLNH